MKTKDARSLPPASQEDIRVKAVNAVLSGKKQVEVAKIFGITRQAVGRWVATYNKYGKNHLKAKKKGRPKVKSRSLKPWQAAQTVKAITDQNPEQLKLPFYLWTREAVAKLMKKRFNITLSVWTVGRYLKDWGMTPQKPLRRAFEQDPKAVQEWLEEKYPTICVEAKKNKAEIYWGDEMGIRSDHQTGTTFGRKGNTPVVPGTGQRFRCNMISAITNRGKLSFMVYKQGFNTKVFKNFLKRLINQIRRKIFLIVDGHPVHRAKVIIEWEKMNKDKIRLFYLPGYSPELNPDEVLNQDVKSNAVGRKRPHGQNEMIRNVRGYLKSRQRKPELVKRYFQEKHVRYAS